MHIPGRIVSIAIRSLSESMDVNLMTHVAREIIDGYDLFERTGFRQSMVVPQRDAARQIINDIVKTGKFFYCIALLIQFHTTGYKGRVYQIKYIQEIVKLVNTDLGYIYDIENRLFVENPSVRRTRNWGALLEGKEYIFTFLRIDIAGNSQLVRKYPEKLIQASYNDLRAIVEKSINKRNGRIWNWEGDGGLVCFYFANKNLMAALSGMEIINELFIYNTMHCRLPEPLKARVAAHTGICHYTEDIDQLLKENSIKETIRIESKHTKPETMTISKDVASKLDSSVLKCFEKVTSDGTARHFSYSIRMEK